MILSYIIPFAFTLVLRIIYQLNAEERALSFLYTYASNTACD